MFISTEVQSTVTNVAHQIELILTDVFCGGFSSFESKTMGCDGAMEGSHVVVVLFAAVQYIVGGRTPSLFVRWLFISTEVQWTV